MDGSIDRMMLSLEGLSVGDAFGELFFRIPPERRSLAELPPEWVARREPLPAGIARKR